MGNRENAPAEQDAGIVLAIDSLKRLEVLLCKEWTGKGLLRGFKMGTDELLQMASCPLDEFMKQYSNYFHEREGFWKAGNPEERRREATKAAVRATSGVDVLVNSLLDRIHQNDQLQFKLALMVINIMTVIGEYFYSQMFPEEIYKCQVL